MRAASLDHFLSKPITLILLGAFMLLMPALLNGFPFVFPDSTDYLTIAPQVFRVPFYGLFITFFHLNQFIWAPVIMQCVVASHLLWLLMHLTSGAPTARNFLPFMLVMTIFTSLPFFTGWIMADIFTPILFLTFYILCFHHRQLSAWMLYYLFLLACVATVTHITNLTLAFGLFGVFVVLLFLAHIPRVERLRSLTLIGGPILLGLIAVLLFNGIIFQSWTLAPAGKTFFLANMIEHGPARAYLDETCPTKHYRICKYRPYPKTANELMWVDKSTIWRLGGFMAMKPESEEIVRDIIRTRLHEVAAMVWDNFLAGLKERVPAAEFYSWAIIKPFRSLVHDKFGHDALHALDASAQANDALPYTAIRAIDDVMAPSCFLLLIIIACTNITARSTLAFRLPAATLCFILGNVLLCTALSGVHDRYQSRVTWLMPMVLGLLFIDYIRKRRT